MANHSEVTPEFFRRSGGDSEGWRRFEALANSLADGVYQLDAEGRFVAVNDVVVEMSGYGWDEILGEHVSVLFDDEGVSHLEDAVETLRGEGSRIATLELSRRTVHGESVACELQFSLLRAGGKFRGTVGTVREVANRRDADRSTEQSDRAQSRPVDAVQGVVYRRRNEPDWPMAYLSDGCAELTGYDADELMSGPREWGDDVVHPDDADRVRAEIRRGAERGGEFAVEYRVRTADGETRWVAERGRAITPADGGDGPVALEGRVTDVTDLKRAERELRERDAELRSLVDAVEEYALFRLDAEGHVESWNPGVERIGGYERDEIIGEHVSTFYTDEAVAEGVPRRSLDEAAERGSTTEEGWRVRKDGSVFWANVTRTAIRGDDGEIEGFATVIRDMTERRERERQLREERDLRDRVFETSPIGIAIFDPDGTLVEANERMAELLDVSADSFDGYVMGDRPFFDEEGEPLDFEDRPAARVVETGEAVSNQRVQVETREGGTRWLSINATPLTDEEGTPAYVVATVTDITQIEEQTRRMSRQRDELEAELADVFDRVTDAFYALDEEWRFTHVNDRAEDVLKREESELLGSRIWDEFENAANSPFREEYERAMETQEPSTFEHYSVSLDTWFEVRAYPSGTGVSVYFQDIGDRKKRQRELERYEQLVETVWDGIYALDPDDRIVLANDAMCELTGYDREELLGEHPTLISSEAVNRAANELEAEMLEDAEKRGALQFDIETKGGETVPVEARFGPYEYDDDRYGRCGVIRDVTDRKQFEETLTALHESSRAFLNAVSEEEIGEIVIDAATDVLDLSGVAVYRYDETEDELVTGATSVKADVGSHEFPRNAAREGSLVGHIFTVGEAQYYEDIRDAPTLQVDRRRTSIRNTFGVPMGEYGVLVVGSTETDALDDQTQELVEVLAANAEAAYARVEHEDELQERVRQQNVVAELGQRALAERDTDALMESAVEAVAETLDMDYCELLELRPEGESLLLKAGVGWEEGLVGSATVDSKENSQASYTLLSQNPVVVEDVGAEMRFTGPDLLTEHGVTSGMSVVVGPQDDPWGVLGAHDTDRRSFTQRDVRFLQSVAYVLAAAIDRRTYERELVAQRTELQKRERALRSAYEVIADPTLSFAERIDGLLRVVRRIIGAGFATFSRIQDGEYVFEAIVVPDGADLRAGDSLPIEQLPNCERVVVDEETLVVNDLAADAPEFADSTWGLSCYLGAPVLVDGDVYGTFCFYGTEARAEEFSDWEVTFVDILSNWVGNELERRRNTDRLAALNSLNEVVRETTEAVIEQSTREEIEQTVCEALAESESYEFAWLGSVARGTDDVYVREEAGVEGYLGGTTISIDEDYPTSRGPTGRAFRTQEIQVARDVLNDPNYESWRPDAETYGYQSSAAIPVVHDGVVYGVLNVYADRADAFADEEQAVIGQLGEVVGHAIAAVERKRALTSDQLIEVDFEIPDVFAELDIAAATDEVITLDQAVPTDDEYLVYGTATEGGIEAVEKIVESVPHWVSVRVVGEDVGRMRFEVRLDEPPVLMSIAALGGYVDHAEIRDGDYGMTIHLPVGTDVRDAIERVQGIYPAAKVRAQRQIDRSGRGSNRLVSALNEELTERQRSVLESAYFSGFFEWPRESSGQEVANSLDISAPTFSQHIRTAENKIFGALFERSSMAR